ncbi:MAG: dihydrolipoyllysine-residue succinyltransferase [Ghiorsea sp.]
MMFEIKVPSLGESDTEATLISWLKDVGDEVEVDDIVAEIESDKITMEITATESGVLTEQKFEVDDTVEPNQVIGLIDTSIEVSKQPQVSPVKEKPAKEPNQPKQEQATVSEEVSHIGTAEREQIRVPMTRLRKRIATRLKEAQNTAAMLTTFNEVNMQPIMTLRTQNKEAFEEKFGAKLGFMSFFCKACALACAEFPTINSYIDGEDVLYHNYIDMGIAVSTENGLIVPVLRDVGLKNYADIEKGIFDLATKARTGGLKPDDLHGGTFSITNGGVFGSMLSTPILNIPQSAILGMHTIQKRAMVEDDNIVIRPMMYLALSYDHRLIDGKDAVQFLVSVKKFLENPSLENLGL